MNINRGDIWLVNLDPTVGAELRKTRPVVVISSDAIGILPIKLVAPITEWKDSHANKLWHVKIDPDSINNLNKVSSIDALQLRGLDTHRFTQKLGKVSPEILKALTIAIAAIIEYES